MKKLTRNENIRYLVSTFSVQTTILSKANKLHLCATIGHCLYSEIESTPNEDPNIQISHPN